MPIPSKPVPPYPGRPALDAANMRMRRAFAAANKYAARKNKPKLIPQLEAIVAETAAVLEANAKRAEALYMEERLRRTAGAAARAGSARAAELLARLEGHVTGEPGRGDG